MQNRLTNRIKSFLYSIIDRKRILRFSKNHRGIKKLLINNRRFKDLYKDQRCFIIGNGPSLKNIDFSLLTDEYVFTVNQISKNPGFHRLKTNFHFWADYRFFDPACNGTSNSELISSMLMVNSEDNKPEVFYDVSAMDFNKNNQVDDILKVHYFALVSVHPRVFLSNHQYDLTKPVPNFATVVQTCICSAIYMGFKEIVLLGCDCTSILNIVQSRLANGTVSEYGYVVSEEEQKRMKEVAKKTSLADELRWQGEIFDAYDFLYEYCKKKGVQLLNATEGSLIESIPKVRLEDILSQ